MSADADAGTLRAVHHDRRIPADPVAVAPLDLLVAGEEGLGLGGDGVDVIRCRQRRQPDVTFAGAAEKPQHQIAGPLLTTRVDHGVERVEPLLRLFGIGIRELGGEPVADQMVPRSR